MVSALRQVIPKVRAVPILANIERILQPVTDFVRGNPIVSTAVFGAGTTGLVAVAGLVRRARKSVKKQPKRKKGTKKKTGRKKRKVQPRKRRKVTHRSPRHKGHKRVAFTTAGGKRVSFLVKKKRPMGHKKIKRRRKR